MTSSSAMRSRLLAKVSKFIRAKSSTPAPVSRSEATHRVVSGVPEAPSCFLPEPISYEAKGRCSPTKREPKLVSSGSERLQEVPQYLSHKVSPPFLQGDVIRSHLEPCPVDVAASTSPPSLAPYFTVCFPPVPPSGLSSRRRRRYACVFDKQTMGIANLVEEVLAYQDSSPDSTMSAESDTSEGSCEYFGSRSRSLLGASTCSSSLTLSEICLPTMSPSTSLSTRRMEGSHCPPARVFEALEELRDFHDEQALDSLLSEWEDCDSPTEPFFDLERRHFVNHNLPESAIGIAL